MYIILHFCQYILLNITHCTFKTNWNSADKQTECNDTARRLSIYKSPSFTRDLLHHGTVAEMWDIHIEFYYTINVDICDPGAQNQS